MISPLTSGERHLEWEGCFNVRDLGGLPTLDGGRTRRGALVRADSLERLTAAGWAALEEHGVRTVVDLRNAHEIGTDAAPRPDSIETVVVELDGYEDREFWDVWESGIQFATPLYYRPHLERMPHLGAAAVAAIARARPGAVAFHCATGRDRTGMVSMLALALVGVGPETIAADYGLTFDRVPPLYAARGEEDYNAEIVAFMRERGTTTEQVITETLAGLDVEATLLAAGLEPAAITALRERLLT
jgi:protein-tyrosine phosphatase